MFCHCSLRFQRGQDYPKRILEPHPYKWAPQGKNHAFPYQKWGKMANPPHFETPRHRFNKTFG